MSRSDVPRADSRPGVRAPEGVLAPEAARAPEVRERRAPAPSAFTTTLAYGVASSRRDHPPPPPLPRSNGVPEHVTQRDSTSLLDLEAKRPEELHLRFGPVTGIAPALPEPRVRRTSPAGMPVPPAAVAPKSPKLRHDHDHELQGHPARSAATQAAQVRLNLRERDPEDSSPTTKFARQSTASGMKARYWVYGLAVGLGAAGLVAAGYSAAFVQLNARDDRAAPQTSTAAATHATHIGGPAPTAAPTPAAPGGGTLPMLAVEPSETADEPGTTSAGRSKPGGGRTHAARARSVPTAPSEPAPEGAAPSDINEQETAEETVQPALAAAPHMESDPVPGASAPAPRLIIKPLGDLPPEPTAQQAPSPAAASSTFEPQSPASEPTAARPSAEPIPSAVPGPAAPQENLPAQLSREDIQHHLLDMRDKLATCAGTQHGTSYANVTINGTGRVSYSTIDGAFAGTPAGSCMARTLRGATFPRFAGPQMTVRYPYVF